MDYYPLIISTISLTVSVTSLVLSYNRMKNTLLPAVEHKMTGLPPYLSEDKETRIEIQNVGNAIAKIDSTWLEFSWDKDLIVVLNYGANKNENGEYFLATNEKKIFFKKLPLPTKSGTHKIRIVTNFNKCLEKTREFAIEID